MQDAEANKKAGCAFLILIIIFVFMFKDCSGDHDNAAIAKVQATQEIQNSSDVKTAPYRGGVAVLDGSAGYWVFNDTVYATNGVAKIKSPSIRYAPLAIDQRDIELAIENYQKDGTINTNEVGQVIDAKIDKLAKISETTLNDKRAVNFYFGEDDRFCSVAATFEHLKANKGHIRTDGTNPEFSVSCDWDGGYFIIYQEWDNLAELHFSITEPAQGNLQFDAELIEDGDKGRILKVNAKDIVFDISKLK